MMEKTWVGDLRFVGGSVGTIEVKASTLEKAAEQMRLFGELLVGPRPKEQVNPVMELANIDPEYRELHAIYVRATEVNEYLLEECGEALRDPLAGELFGHYAALGQAAAALLIFVQTRLKAGSPLLMAAWRSASKLP